jgi:transcriptional regulator with XRE-family HTH domain
MYVPFGDWLRQRRKDANLNQLELAEAAATRNIYLSYFECGDRLPHWALAVRIADVLGISINEMAVRLVTERLMKIDEGRIFLAEAAAGRLTNGEGVPQ